MIKIPPAPLLPRGRIATWTRERLDKLTTDELKALLANAERLQETEVAQLCRAIIKARPRGAAATIASAAAHAKG